jgi:hypothetical protein
MKYGVRFGILSVVLLLAQFGQISAQIQTERPKRASVQEPKDELTEMKADLAKMQSLLNQMQAVFSLVGNPTSPANHELELNIDMWRILINQMQRRVDHMERAPAGLDPK